MVYETLVESKKPLMAKKIAPVMEKWLLALVSPYLSDAPRAVQQFLDEQG